jgi:hypothetical protein
MWYVLTEVSPKPDFGRRTVKEEVSRNRLTWKYNSVERGSEGVRYRLNSSDAEQGWKGNIKIGAMGTGLTWDGYQLWVLMNMVTKFEFSK